MFEPDQIIGNHFKIVKLLGTGGMGEVYQATDINLQRDVAIKVLSEEAAANENLVERFVKEGQLLATVRHPSVLEIYVSGRDEESGRIFLAMELIEGKSLIEFRSEIRDDRKKSPMFFFNFLRESRNVITRESFIAT